MSYRYIWLVCRTLLSVTAPGQSEAGGNGNKGILHIPQSSRTGASLSNDLMLYLGHMLRGRVLPFAEMQSVYSTAPADWAAN